MDDSELEYRLYRAIIKQSKNLNITPRKFLFSNDCKGAYIHYLKAKKKYRNVKFITKELSNEQK